MTDRRKRHGAHPEDPELFSTAQCGLLRQALTDFAFLLDRGYPREASLKLVGDRFALRSRQRAVLNRAGCSRTEAASRKTRECKPGSAVGRLLVDGYNVLNTLECALGGALIIRCMDGAYRDIGGVHGNYRLLDDTPQAVSLILEACRSARAEGITILLDAPISNSGRLKTLIYGAAEKYPLQLAVEVVPNPDAILISDRASTAVTSDSLVLDRCGAWYNLTKSIVEHSLREAWAIDMSIS